MEIIRGIYKITSPSNKVYIGRSVNILARFNYYKYSKKDSQRKLYNSFKKYGISSHKFEIIISGNFNNTLLNELERHYIQLYNTTYNGLNLTTGGEGLEGYKHSEKTKLLQSLNKLGKPFSEEHRKNLSASKLNVKRGPLSEEHKAKISKSHLGLKASEETKLKLSKAHTGKIISESTREKMRVNSSQRKHTKETKEKISKMFKGKVKYSKPVICIESGRTWKSAKECWEELYSKIMSRCWFTSMLSGKTKNKTTIRYI